MREALIVWGGWNGHEPEQCASTIAGLLEGEGFKVRVETSTQAFADPALLDMSLVIPIYTMSKIEKHELSSLAKAVRDGVGLAAITAACATPSVKLSSTSSCAAASGSHTPATSSITA